MLLKQYLVIGTVSLAGCEGQCGDSYVDAGDADACPTICSSDAGVRTCTDLELDGLNCGTCGHACQSATCVFGSCAIVVAADAGATSIAVDDAGVYWVAGDTVMSASLAGGAPVTIAVGQIKAAQVVADGRSAFWTTSLGLMSAPHDGGAVSVLALGVIVGRPAVDSTNVYWIEGSDSGTTLDTVDKTGGTPTIIGVANGSSAVTVDSANIYWTSNTPGLSKTSKDASVDVATVLAPQGGNGDFIAVDTSDVYWLNPSVMQVPKLGGPALLLATGTATWATNHALVVDGTSAFWIGAPPPNGFGGDVADIVMVSRAGGSPTILRRCSVTCPSDLAVDSTFLYWAEDSIFKVAKP